MANECYFEVRAKGSEDAIRTLFDWLSAVYNYTDEDNPKVFVNEWVNGEKREKPVAHHIGYRVFDFFGDFDESYGFGSGSCAWSTTGCMFDEPFSYLREHRTTDNNRLSISLPEACKELGVEVELFSCECGFEFSEHYHILSDGTVALDTVDYAEYYVGDCVDWEDYEYKDQVSKEIYEKAKGCYDTEFVAICDHLETPWDGGWKWKFILD